jgi:hypothetical protein
LARSQEPSRFSESQAPLGGGGEPFEEAQRDRAVDVSEQADSAGEDDAQVGPQLVGDRDPVLDEVLAGPHVAAQGDCRRRVGFEAAPAVSVGAQAVSEHVGVGPVGLVAGGAVALPQGLDRPARNHDDLEAGFEQAVDHGSIGTFDRHARTPAPWTRRHSSFSPAALFATSNSTTT